MFKRILQNETGQMAIFVALIFQVLFVLFAMVINIGLIVHDKINLQNSVDLAAYYAAERQAEAMNMIAHINYQMRQDYKLLTWRYRVLGSFGTERPMHPALAANGDLSEVEWSPGKDGASVCIGHRGWFDSSVIDKDANNCKWEGMRIPDLKPIGSVPALALGIAFDVADQFKEARNIIRNQCQKLSPYNWGLATMMIASFKVAGSQRKKQIQKLASELSKDGDFLDVHGLSVRDGALKTFEKNLTASNKDPASFVKSEEDSFVILNGLSQGGCGQLDELGFPAWLQDIPISPIVRYTELVTGSGGSSQCDATTKSYSEPPTASTLATIDPSGELRKYAGEPAGKDWLRSSRGFEKNPWCLAYIAIKAKTKPRKPFAPFGSPITMEARAYAEPFGGRIGPWYGKTWPAQATQSDGSSQTDELAVPRGDFDPQYKNLYLPNYSRFPGDRLGLKSKLALGLMRSVMSPAFFSDDRTKKFNFSDYGSLIPNIYNAGDPLAWNNSGFSPSRLLEMKAVTPDLFDIAYYSVDPEYYLDYYKAAKERLFQGIAPISDIGARSNGELDGLRIKNQIAAFNKEIPESKDAFYILKDWKHLLTGWMQGGAVEFDSRAPAVADRFGNCLAEPSAQQPPTAGACIAGGRVGYSVRLIHKDYLQAEHELGGSGAGKDKLRNPPPQNF